MPTDSACGHASQQHRAAHYVVHVAVQEPSEVLCDGRYADHWAVHQVVQFYVVATGQMTRSVLHSL